MNYWNDNYLQTANPVNDLSMEVEGQAATDVSRYDDVLWTWTCDHRHGFHTDVTLINLRDCVKIAKTQTRLANGTVPMMVVGHLGNGISVPGEPYHKESAPFARPPLHGNKCAFFQRDASETNDSRAYEYRNPGEAAVRALIQRAQKSIFISQQDLLSCLPKPLVATEAKFDERLFAILASKIVAGVPITIVLSAGGGGAAGYSNGWTLKDLAKILKEALEVDAHLPSAQARAKLCHDVGLAALRNGPHAKWANGNPFSNHAKLVAVDHEAFYIGSQNLYPGRLQELGVIVEDAAAYRELNSAYLRPMWDWSQRDALINPATKKCDVCGRSRAGSTSRPRTSGPRDLQLDVAHVGRCSVRHIVLEVEHPGRVSESTVSANDRVVAPSANLSPACRVELPREREDEIERSAGVARARPVAICV
jgi:phosphatidylserine/phosphatidylglycerophosphate/cardiolipin synthase-like enzyme